MAIVSKPIYVGEIVDGGPSGTVSLEAAKAKHLDDVVGHGWIARSELQPGFKAYAAQYVASEDYSICRSSDSGVMISLYWGDGYAATYDGSHERLSGGSFSIRSFEDGMLSKHHRPEGKHQTRCSVLLDHEWIGSDRIGRHDETGAIRKLLSQSGLSKSGTASPRMLLAGAQLFSATCWSGPLSSLRCEAAALSFMAEALSDVEIVNHDSLSRIDVIRISRVKEYLDEMPPDGEVSLSELAMQHAMSVRSLCRHFQLVFGTTVVSYVSAARLDRARAGLESGEVTIEQAAYLAGFQYASNFSKAFRRRFGYPPSAARGRR